MITQYKTPVLQYNYDALEPHIDKETMKIHHDKHHVAYTTKLNLALKGHEELFQKTPEELLQNLQNLPKGIQTAVRNNGGGHVNHSLFWNSMGPHAGGAPEGKLLKAINSTFGSFKSFKKTFEELATTQFGSGWAWLSVDSGKLIAEHTPNQDSPLSEGRTPILALDVWEHAYYLQYKNVRPDYIASFWNVVNWKAVNTLFESTR